LNVPASAARPRGRQLMERTELAGYYKGFEIFTKSAITGTRFVAYQRNEIVASAHATTLEGIRSQIDAICEKILKEREGKV